MTLTASVTNRDSSYLVWLSRSYSKRLIGLTARYMETVGAVAGRLDGMSSRWFRTDLLSLLVHVQTVGGGGVVVGSVCECMWSSSNGGSAAGRDLNTVSLGRERGDQGRSVWLGDASGWFWVDGAGPMSLDTFSYMVKVIAS